jgi:uncharacterized protein YbjT (DUF2867 family)
VLRDHRIDAVVNCVGIWIGTVEQFELVQYTVPVALFDACSQLGIRVVHLSALGFSAQSTLPYASTKARADQVPARALCSWRGGLPFHGLRQRW